MITRLLFFLIAIVLSSCQNSKKKAEVITENCDNQKLLNYIYPINNFIKERTLIYSLKSNKEPTTEFYKNTFKLKIEKDSLLFSVSKNSNGITNDSTIYTINNGIPKILKTFTRADIYPGLIPATVTTTGNKYCEFGTFGNSFKYVIPTENGDVTREFKGYATHVKYVKEVFKGVEYNCAIIESKKTLSASFNGKTEKLKGTWKGCACENIGELYSTTTTENGLVIETKLVDIIEN